MLAAIRYNTVLHPYLIADNRHYAFYVFRKLLLRYRGAKEAAVAVYYAAWVGISGLLSISRSESDVSGAAEKDEGGREEPKQVGTKLSWLLLWFTCTTATLVTAPLVEPRYFITAWVLWRLHVSPAAEGRKISGVDALLWVESLWAILVNAGTLWMFLKRPFEWEHEKGVVQRFMW